MLVPKWVYRFRGYLITPPIIFAIFCFGYETESEFVWPLGVSLFIFGVASSYLGAATPALSAKGS